MHIEPEPLHTDGCMLKEQGSESHTKTLSSVNINIQLSWSEWH